MKKLLVLFFLLVCMFCLNTFQTQTLFDVFASDASEFYITTNQTLSSELAGVKNGNGFIYKIEKNDASLINGNIKNITSQSVVLNKNNLNFITKKLNLKIVSVVKQNDVIEVLGYSNKLNDFMYVNAKKVNVQIAVNSSSIIVGYPLILQGF